MTSEWMRRYRIADIVLLVCVVALTIATWAALCGTERVPAWKPCLGASATMFLALAALTPHDPWAAALRLAFSGWLVAAPWLLAFSDLAAVRWSYLLAGGLIAALSMRPFLRPAGAASVPKAEIISLNAGSLRDPALNVRIALRRMWS